MHLLLAPPAAKARTGGAVYNRRVAAILEPEGFLRYRIADSADISRAIADAGAAAAAAGDAAGVGAAAGARAGSGVDSLLLDGLYLDDPDFAAVFDRISGVEVGLLLHFMPSVIDPAAREREDAVIAGSSYFVVPSRYAATELESRGVDPDRIGVVKPGVDEQKLARPTPELFDTGTPRLLTVANFSAVKELDWLIGPLEQVADLDWRWEILGDTKADPESYTRFRRRLAGSAIVDRVQVHGSVAEEEVQQILQRGTVFLLPTRFEPYGVALAEALASGVPIVTNRVGGVDEVVRHGEVGYLLERGDEAAWAGSIRRLLEDSDLLGAFRGNARFYRLELPTWKITARRLEKFLRRMTGAG